MTSISTKEFLKGGRIKKIDYNQPKPEEKEPGYFERVIGKVRPDLEQRADKVENIRGRDTNPLLKGFQAVGQGAGAAANILETLVTEAPGVKKALEPVGKGMQWAMEPGKEALGKFGQGYEQLKPDAKDTVEAAGNLFRLGTDIEAAASGTKLAVEGGKKVVQGTKNLATSVAEGTKGLVQGKVPEGISPNIMDRIARLNPTDEVKFKKVAGKSPGQYLDETGNFGTPDEIITNESKKFIESKAMVDDELAKLPGEYKVGHVDDALELLVKKGTKVSSPNTPSQFLSRAKELLAKSQSQGLNMAEINEVKRLFEREIRLGYNKMMKPNLVQKATEIDSAIRNWQVSKADYLGFKNISELNRQTRIAKFLADKLGDKIVGQQALNNVSLTDWIVLSGGDPTGIAGFLTKKFFSSKSIQAKIAKMLSKADPKGIIKPKTFQPAGLLEEPKVLDLPGEGILEGQAKIN